MGRQPGEPVALRDVRGGRIWSARPATVVRDAEPPLMLFMPAGVRWMAPTGPDGSRLRPPADDWRLEPDSAPANVLSFAWPDRRYAVLVIWNADWSFAHWYVNVEEPLRPTAVGYDYEDLVLDAVVQPDRSSWAWKDEEELARAIASGMYAADEEPALRRAAEDGVRHVLAARPPFDRDWSDWRPDPAWPVPEFPPGWDVLR